MQTEKIITVTPEGVSTTAVEVSSPLSRHTRGQMALAFGVAAVSDALSIWVTFAPPLQWTIDLATAIALYVIFGKRWALLPGLVVEAIPGMGVFPWWVLVVLSIILYDGVKKPHKSVLDFFSSAFHKILTPRG